tara:strand:+ start:48 stop:266 length:219 start_codon:yes stop_codon:yes gene_type:complete
MDETTIIYDSVTLVLRGHYEAGRHATYLDAPEPRYFEIYEVVCGKQNIIDILDDNVIKELEQLAVEQYEDYV